jgi:hypothetical protein
MLPSDGRALFGDIAQSLLGKTGFAAPEMRCQRVPNSLSSSSIAFAPAQIMTRITQTVELRRMVNAKLDRHSGIPNGLSRGTAGKIYDKERYHGRGPSPAADDAANRWARSRPGPANSYPESTNFFAFPTQKHELYRLPMWDFSCNNRDRAGHCRWR